MPSPMKRITFFAGFFSEESVDVLAAELVAGEHADIVRAVLSPRIDEDNHLRENVML